MEKMMQDKDYPGVDGTPFQIILPDNYIKPKPAWEPSENTKLREELYNQQLKKMAEQWAKDFPWLAERYLDESTEGIQDSQQG
jgi:hypothetical protein